MRKTNLLSRATRSPLRPTLCVPDTWLQEAGWCAFLLLAANPQSPTQTLAGCTLSSPGPAPHATQTQFFPRFPFPPGLGGLLSEVSEITVSVMAKWGGRWLHQLVLHLPGGQQSCWGRINAQWERNPRGTSRHSSAYFWLGGSRGHFCPMAPALCNACKCSLILWSSPLPSCSPLS